MLDKILALKYLFARCYYAITYLAVIADYVNALYLWHKTLSYAVSVTG
jgi:hypothetical protein